jgi:hypothetical protein
MRCTRRRVSGHPAHPSHQYLLVGLLGIALTAGAFGRMAGPASTASAAPQPVPAAGPAAGAPPAAAPLDEPLRLLGEARQSYQRVRDYTCTLIKQERVRGQLQPENMMTMRVRTQPFSVYLKWYGPKQFAGQEVSYVAGRNGNMMSVHSTGLMGAVGFVKIAPNDPRVLQHSRHTITEAGIGNLIERYATRWEAERRQNKTQVRLADYEYNKRRCSRVECIHPEKTPDAYCYRNIVYFDKETRLPIRTESYDWPRQGGPPGGDLLEAFSFVDLRFNVNLNDAAFPQ